MRRNSPPPSKQCELAPEQEAAEHEHRLANKNGGEHRPPDANEGNKSARRCGYAYGKWNVVERTAWKKDELGDDRRKNGCRDRARPDDDLRVFIEPASQHQPEHPPARFHWVEIRPGSAPDTATARRWSF